MVNSKKESRKPTAMETLVGKTLLTSLDKTESTTDVMKGKDLVLLYFSASWCPPCKKFTPVLSKFYLFSCIPNNIEIIYVSSDSDLPSFNTYYGQMPWKSLPAVGTASIKQKLADSLKIEGIPSLAVFDKNGLFVSDTARPDVMSAADDSEKSQALIDQWKAQKAVPIEEAQLSGKGQGGFLWTIFKNILSNPMYMIGLFYMAKQLMKKLQDIGTDEVEGGEL
mmetsp:Transcript_30110/g.35012  ORF Transcript_30110/g.35012 Transcript_30110/m.35012 type:complete len:223 (+) Transcript_30110:152-820(+)